MQTYARATKVFLRWLVKNDYIDIDLKKIQLIKFEKNIIYPLRNDEIELLFNHFDSTVFGKRNKLICMLMLDCGLRRGEIPKIKKQNIYYDNYSILINGKGSKERMVIFGSTVKSQIQLYNLMNSNNKTEYLFTTNKNTPLTKNAIKIMFQKLNKKRVGTHISTFVKTYI